MPRSRAWLWVITTTRAPSGARGHFAGRVGAAQRTHVGGHRGREGVRTLVHPRDVEGERRQRQHQRAADVSGAEQPHRTSRFVEPLDNHVIAPEHDRRTGVHAIGADRRPPSLWQALARGIATRRGVDDDRSARGTVGSARVAHTGRRPVDHQAFHPVRKDASPGRERAGGFARGEGADFVEPLAVEHLGQQPHAPAAALAEIGAQREPVERRGRSVRRQRVARHTDRSPLQLAAADGSAEAAVRRYRHPRPRLARRRTADLRDRHERAAPVRGDYLRDHRPRPHPFSPPCAAAGHPARLRTTAIRLTPIEMCPSFATHCNADSPSPRTGAVGRRVNPVLPGRVLSGSSGTPGTEGPANGPFVTRPGRPELRRSFHRWQGPPPVARRARTVSMCPGPRTQRRSVDW